MKRNLCAQHAYQHIHHKKLINLSETECTICRWKKRPLTLKDFARELEYIAEAMRSAHEHPDYDPFGYTYADPFNNIIKEWYKTIHESYRNNAIKKLLKEIGYKHETHLSWGNDE